MKQILNFSKLQRDYQALMLQAKGYFLGRIIEVPFKVDSGISFKLKYNMEPIINSDDKKELQKILRIL